MKCCCNYLHLIIFYMAMQYNDTISLLLFYYTVARHNFTITNTTDQLADAAHDNLIRHATNSAN